MTAKKSFPAYFFHDYRSLPFPRKLLEKTAYKIYKNEKRIARQRINIILCSDYKIRKLNQRYRKTDRPTDVLSFNFDEEDFLGEIYISLQRAAIQARRYHVTYDYEVNKLFIHGLLHLLGFDHNTKEKRLVMELYEKQFC